MLPFPSAKLILLRSSLPLFPLPLFVSSVADQLVLLFPKGSPQSTSVVLFVLLWLLSQSDANGSLAVVVPLCGVLFDSKSANPISLKDVSVGGDVTLAAAGAVGCSSEFRRAAVLVAADGAVVVAAVFAALPKMILAQRAYSHFISFVQIKPAETGTAFKFPLDMFVKLFLDPVMLLATEEESSSSPILLLFIGYSQCK